MVSTNISVNVHLVLSCYEPCSLCCIRSPMLSDLPIKYDLKMEGRIRGKKSTNQGKDSRGQHADIPKIYSFAMCLISERVAWQIGPQRLNKRAAQHTSHIDLRLRSALQLACSKIFASETVFASKMTFLKLRFFQL